MNASHEELRRFSPDELAAGLAVIWIAAVRRQSDLRWANLAFHVRASLSRGEVLGLGELVVDEVIALLRRLLPILADVRG